MAFFKVTKMKSTGKYYPTAVLVDKPMEIEELAGQISEMSTVSKADILAVLAALPGVMSRGMNSGRSVHLQDLGFFRYTIDARKGGRDTEKEVVPDDVERTRIRFTPETRFSTGRVATRALTPESVRWVKWKGETVDDSNTGDGGTGDNTGTGGDGGGVDENPFG